jgi:hypothetical protein
MPVRAGILNPFGVANAGAMLWYADLCLPQDRVRSVAAPAPPGISLDAHLIENQKDGSFTATSMFVKRGPQLSAVRTAINGDN